MGGGYHLFAALCRYFEKIRDEVVNIFHCLVLNFALYLYCSK